MKKLRIKAIIEFRRRKSDKTRATFLNSLKVEKEKKDDDPGGGDYWITSLSALAGTYRLNDVKIIKRKITELEQKRDNVIRKQTKDMHQKNIDILKNYVRFDFDVWRAAADMKIIKREHPTSILPVKGLPMEVRPHHFFKFNDSKEIGAIWFLAKKGGFRRDELGMFAEGLYRYLKAYYKDGIIVNPEYCIAVDVISQFDVNYLQVQEGEVDSLLLKTINEINRLL